MILLYKYPALYLLAAFLLSCANNTSGQVEKKLSTREFYEKLNQTDQLQLLDVRTPEEYKNGHLTQAVNIDWNGGNFLEEASKLDPGKPVFIYCLSGGRSHAAAKALRKKGFEVYEMKEGLLKWRADNLPVTSAASPATDAISTSQYRQMLVSEKLILVDFYADWCAPCKKMKPYLEKISTEMTDKVNIIRIDADANPDLCRSLNITALPVLKLYKDQQIIWEHTGYINEAGIRKQLDP